MNKKIALGFIVYGSSANFLDRLQHVAAQNTSIYVFDNSPSNSELRISCKTLVNVRYLTVGKNLGLGYGLSAICAQAFYDENDALIFFDQDTVFNTDTLNFIDQFYSENFSSLGNFSAITFGASKKVNSAAANSFTKVPLTLNSGSLFILKNLAAIGWHNENYFVDGVDYEFCLNSDINGFDIGSYIGAPGFDHVAEQDDRPYQIFGKTFLWRSYPTFRVIDTAKSSMKLIYASLISGRFVFAKKFIRFFIIYMGVQVISRILNPVYDIKRPNESNLKI